MVGEKKDCEESRFFIKILYVVRERVECGLIFGVDW